MLVPLKIGVEGQGHAGTTKPCPCCLVDHLGGFAVGTQMRVIVRRAVKGSLRAPRHKIAVLLVTDKADARQFMKLDGAFAHRPESRPAGIEARNATLLSERRLQTAFALSRA